MPRPSHPKSDSNLSSLPQKSSTWHVAIRKLGFKAPVEGGGEIYPHVVVVVDLTLELFLAMEPFEKRPDTSQVQEVLFGAMRQPADGKKIKPYRPIRVEFEQPEMLHDLSPALWEIEVTASAGQPAAIIDEVIEGLNQVLGGQQPEVPGLLSIPGMTARAAERLFEAALIFYKSAPWDVLTSRDTLRVKFGDSGEERIAHIMGGDSTNQGITLYREWEDVLKAYNSSDEDPLEGMPEDGVHGLTFVAKESLPPEDQAAIKRYRWKVANRMAYPLPVIFTPVAVFRPDRQEIVFYEALMRAVPVLIEQQFRQQSAGQGPIPAYQPFETTIEVTTIDGPMRLEFTYPAGELPEIWEIDEDEDDWEDDFFDEPIQMELSPTQQQAAELMSQAWEKEDGQEQRELARQAVQIAPDYPESYLLLGQTAETSEEAVEWYRKGVAAGEALITPEWLDEHGEELRNIKEGLDVLYLRHGLASSLADLGRYEEALELFQEVLELDEEEDEVGARFDTFGLLLRLKRDQEAAELLDQYDDLMDIYLPYGRALLEFRQNGNTPAARKALKEGVRQNKWVLPFLTGVRPLPADEVEIDDPLQRQASMLARDLYPSWWSTPGAIDWLKKHALS